jgi:hypothetical protein
MPDDQEPKQKTTPKGKDKSGKPFEPINIPVPKRSTFENLVRKASGGQGRKGKP